MMRIDKNLTFLFAFMLFVCQLQAQTQFTTGNLVALRVSPNPQAYGQTGPVTLVEYTPTGSVTGYTVAIPSTDTTRRLLLGGNNSYEGQMTLSNDGRFLCFVGYDLPNNVTANPATALSQANATKVIAKVNKLGVVDITTRIPTTKAFGGTGVRTVASKDGSGFWVSCSTNDVGTGTLGTHYVVSGATNATTFINAARSQSLSILNGVLYTANAGLNYYSTLPTAAADFVSAGTYNANAINNTQYVFLDTDTSKTWNNTPFDVLYVADAATSNGTTGLGISKYYVNANAWTLAGVFDVTGSGTALLAMTGAVVGGKPVLYAVKGNVADNEIISITDNAARISPMAVGTTTVRTLAYAGTDQFFRGIAFAPRTTLGVATLDETDKATIFPNPVRTNLIIQLANAPNEGSHVEIMNSFGAIVKKQTLTTQATEVNVAELSNGLHIVVMRQKGRILSVNKFIKE